MKIIVISGNGRDMGNGTADAILPAFLPNGSVCPDGEHEGKEGLDVLIDGQWCKVDYGYPIITGHKTRKVYRCNPISQSPADKYIAALEGLKKTITDNDKEDAMYFGDTLIDYKNSFNEVIDEAIKTIKEL